MPNVAENLNVPPPNHVLVLDGQGWIGLVDQMGTETSIVNAARVSFGKIRREMDQRDAALVKYLIANHHTSPLEHVMFTFLVHCPLFVRSQWHRHRTWSYNEISRRYTNEDITFYLPGALREQAESDRQASKVAEHIKQDECRALIAEHHAASLRLFERLLAEGVCREQARGVLPQNMMTTFWATVDLNNLIKFIELRDSPHAQSEIREYGQAIKKLITPIVPHVAEVLNWS
ncbi:MAG TPA: FAD-dependent thymidylate synthase [Lentisphaeria bacterium]|nr:FAD-dependent thymidylate synthase [Lentisphaeria bacterium]